MPRKEESEDELILEMLGQGHSVKEVASKFKAAPFHVWELERKLKDKSK